VENVDEDHRVGDGPVELVLLEGKGKVEEAPGHEAGALLAEELDVDWADEGDEVAAHPKVVKDVATVAVLGDARTGHERDCVHVDAEDRHQEHRRRQQLGEDVVQLDERQPVKVHVGKNGGRYNGVREQAVEAVRVARSVGLRQTKALLAGEDEVQDDLRRANKKKEDG